MDRDLKTGPLVWLGIILTTCLLLVLFQTMLWLVLPFLLAVVAYYILSPAVNFAISRGLSRGRAVLIVTGLLCLFLIAAGMIVEPKVAAVSHDWQGKIADYAKSGTDLVARAQATLTKMLPAFSRPTPASTIPPRSKNQPTPEQQTKQTAIEESKANDAAAEQLRGNAAELAKSYSGGIVLELLHWIPSLLLIPYLTYFFLLDGPRFKRFLVQAIPNAFFEKTLYLFFRIDEQLRRYFQGMLTLTALDAVCLGIGLWFLGFPAPFFLALLAAMMSWLPYLGSIAGCVMVVLVAAHHDPNSSWLPYEAIALFLVVRLLDDFIFLPLTVGRSLQMHPLITVLMILLGGAVAGISGLLLVMPVLGVVMVAGQIIGELITDERILARHRHARQLRLKRAQAGL
jgi:predicted PurR-regulated permease PerM